MKPKNNEKRKQKNSEELLNTLIYITVTLGLSELIIRELKKRKEK